MTDLSTITYEDLLKDKLILYNDDINTPDFVLKTLIELFGYNIIEAFNIIIRIEKEGKAKIHESNYVSLLEYKLVLNNLNLKAEIE